MAISRQQLTKELEPGLNALFGLEYNRYENEHAEIYNTESSDRAFEEEVMLSAFAGAPVKQEEQQLHLIKLTKRTQLDTHTRQLLLRLQSLRKLSKITCMTDLRVVTQELLRDLCLTQNKLKQAAVLNNAQVTTVLGGDGVPLISSAHPLANGGTFSNVLATASDLNETSLEQMLIDIAGFVDERGLKIAAQGRKMIIPKELQFTAERLMKSPLRVGTADNDINAIGNMGMIPEGYRVNHFLTDTDSFFILTDTPNGLKHFERSPIRTAIEGDFDTGNVRFKARERYSFGFSDPRCVFGNGNLPTS
jgi:hypothetical protein